MTPMAWTVLVEAVVIVLLIWCCTWAMDQRDTARDRVTWLEAEQTRLAQTWAEKLAKAETGRVCYVPPERDNLPRLINRLEAYRQGAPARRLEGE